jgi:hypothetical protein
MRVEVQSDLQGTLEASPKTEPKPGDLELMGDLELSESGKRLLLKTLADWGETGPKPAAPRAIDCR